jgi:hypothetical protein
VGHLADEFVGEDLAMLIDKLGINGHEDRVTDSCFADAEDLIIFGPDGFPKYPTI